MMYKIFFKLIIYESVKIVKNEIYFIEFNNFFNDFDDASFYFS